MNIQKQKFVLNLFVQLKEKAGRQAHDRLVFVNVLLVPIPTVPHWRR